MDDGLLKSLSLAKEQMGIVLVMNQIIMLRLIYYAIRYKKETLKKYNIGIFLLVLLGTILMYLIGTRQEFCINWGVGAIMSLAFANICFLSFNRNDVAKLGLFKRKIVNYMEFILIGFFVIIPFASIGGESVLGILQKNPVSSDTVLIRAEFLICALIFLILNRKTNVILLPSKTS